MSEGQHAVFSPSNSKRWLNCTQSMLLPKREEKRSKDNNSYANRGTALHEYAEIMLTEHPGNGIPESIEGYTPTEDDMELTVIPYVDYVKALDADKKFYEVKVRVTDECYGTADCVAYNSKTKALHVVDLKAGQGVFVPVIDNTQLMTYAIGAVAYLAERDLEVAEVHTHVVQPGMNNIASCKVELSKLQDLKDEIVTTIEQVAQGKGVYSPGVEECRWCPHKTTCPKLSEMANMAAKNEFENLDLSAKLNMVPALKLFIKAVEEEAFETLDSGKALAGFKLVAGRGTRKWKNEKQLLSVLKDSTLDYDKLFDDKKLLSVAQLEKHLKKQKFDFDLSKYVETTYGDSKVAPESSLKKEVNEGPEQAFKGL